MESQAPPPLLTLHFNKISQRDVFSYTQRSLRSLTVNTSVTSTKMSFPILLIKNKTEEFGDMVQAVVERAWVHIPACTETSGVTTSICNLSAREVEPGGSLGLWPVSLIESGSSRFSGRLRAHSFYSHTHGHPHQQQLHFRDIQVTHRLSALESKVTILATCMHSIPVTSELEEQIQQDSEFVSSLSSATRPFLNQTTK